MKIRFCSYPSMLWLTVTTIITAIGPGGAQALLSPTNYPVGVNPYSVEVGDLDGDGKADLISTNFGNNTLSVLRGRGDGVFLPALSRSVGSNPISVVIGNFDNDTQPDAIVGNYGSNSVSYLRGNGNGTLQPPVNFPTGNNPYEVIAGHFDNDGDVDIATANGEASSLSVLLGNGNGTFAAKTDYTVGPSPFSLTQGDFNGDSNLDLVCANFGSDNISVLLGNGNGTFQFAATYPTGDGPRGLVPCDLDDDGFLDLATANQSANTVSVLSGNGNGTFDAPVSYAVGQSPVSIVAGDFDGSGKLDLATANASSDTVSVLLGNGNLIFAAAISYAAGANTLGIAAGQLNPGTQTDLATANRSANSVSVFLNSTDIVTNTNDSGAGSLRQAILNANAAAGDDTITFAPGLTGVIQLAGALPDLASNIHIQGPGAGVLSVRGEGTADPYRIFLAAANQTITISGLTIVNGYDTNVGGGIANDHALLIVRDCVLTGNGAGNGGGGLYNNGEVSLGKLTVENCTFSQNAAVNGGGALYNDGYTGDAQTTLTNCTFTKNTAGAGGAIFSSGGGNGSTSGSAMLTVMGCTFTRNIATENGGAIYSNGPQGTATLGIANSTFYNNDASSQGGAIFNAGIGGLATATVKSCTFNVNNASFGGSAIWSSGLATSMVQLSNNIFGVGVRGITLADDGNGSLVSQGYNLASDSGGGYLTATGDQINLAALKLGPLANNGGPTQTIKLLPGGPAINAGDPAYTGPLQTDQRGTGFARVQGGRLDIGAFEAAVLQISNVTVTEGDTGTTSALFTVTLSVASTQSVTVQYAAIKGNTDPALVSRDFHSTKGTLTFAPGETTKTITVPIVGDYVLEADETFFVKLSNAVNVALSDTQGLGTITNDDFDTTPPSVSFTTPTTTPGGSTPLNGGTVYNVMPAITGIAADAGSGIARVQLRLYRRTADPTVFEYWNNSAWVIPGGSVPIPMLITALSGPAGSASVTWSRSTGWPSASDFADGTYYLTAYAFDRAGQFTSSARNFKKSTDSNGPSVSFTTEATTPVGTTPVNGGTVSKTMPIITGIAADSLSGIAKVVVRLYRATATAGVYEYWTGSGWTTTVTNLSTTLNPAEGGATVTWSRSTDWPADIGDFGDGTYYLRATAYDKAGNLTATLASSFKKVTSAEPTIQVFENDEPSQ